MCLTYINQYADEGYDSGYFKKGTKNLLNEANKLLLARIRPQIIPMAESTILFQDDNLLMSAILIQDLNSAPSINIYPIMKFLENFQRQAFLANIQTQDLL